MAEPLLTVSILISNRADNVRRCLESVQPLLKNVPSELILTDTGCGKEVRKIIESYTDHIIDFKWCKDFSAARNVGLQEAKGKWFLYLDDDEWFENTNEIQEFLLSDEKENYNVAFYVQRNYLNAEGTKYRDHYVDRLLRREKGLHFEHRIHEAYTGIIVGEKKRLDDFVHHYGYVYKDEEEKMKKHYRNQELLEQECRDYPQDMRIRYQLVVNPYTVGDWDTSIKYAKEAIEQESDSEYWDACHTSILYCLEKKQDWTTLIQVGEEFLTKRLYPYDTFGVMQFMIDAYWNTKQWDELCDMAERALEIYQRYAEDPHTFNQNQLMRTEFVERDYMLYFLMYSVTAGLRMERDSLLQKLTTGATADFVEEILNTEELAGWINAHISEKKEDGRAQEKVEKENRERLEFEASFFEQEERNGFVIEPMMKNAWAANLQVLHIIDRICEENNIAYFADWGTMLGAVRHHGYIPWDDDIDICMLRKDYLRFCKVIEQYRDEVSLLNIYNSCDWGEHAEKVVNIAAFTVKRSEIKKYNGFPFTAGVDIFLIDYVPRDKALEEEQLEVLRTISALMHLRGEMREQDPRGKEYKESKYQETLVIKKLQEMTNVQFSQENPTDQEVLILGEEVAGFYGKEDADYLAQLQLLGVGWDYYIPEEVYETTVRIPFENTTIPVPAEYDMLLRKKYGDDYITPINVEPGHDYPFYNKAISEVASIKNQKTEEVKRYVSKIATDYYAKFLRKSPEPKVSYKKEYFQTEMIGNTEVTAAKKRRWAAQTEVYLEVKRLCQEHDLPLFAIGETLMGAVSINNFLPESDEMCFAMKREDYMKFLVILQEDMDPWFDYRNIYAYEDYEDMRCYVFSDGYLCDEAEYRKRFHGCEETVGIYISAIDSISENESKEDVRCMLIKNLLQTAESMPPEPPYSDEVKEIVEKWRKLAQVEIDISNNLRREFVKAADSVAGSYRGEGKKVRISSEMQDGNAHCYNQNWFHDIIEIKFGEITVDVPIGYKEM